MEGPPPATTCVIDMKTCHSAAAFALCCLLSPALVAQGEIVSWGYDIYGQVSDTPPGTGFTQIAGGWDHSLALRTDGSIVSWGYDFYGQVSNTPPGTGFTQVAGGWYHSLALRTDGSMVSWGKDNNGQVSDTPPGTGFTQIAGGFGHSHALRTDGSIVSWGYDGFGLVSDTPPGTGFTQIATGGDHSLALRTDGSIVSWGRDNYGQVSNTPPGTGFSQITAGWFHSLAVAAGPWDQSHVNGHWYRAIEELTWAEAEAQAQASGGHLATVRSQAENDWLVSTFAGDGSFFWIGYHDSNTEGQFEWASGETPGYTNWRTGEPDDLNGADWAALIPSTGTWIDETFLPERRSVVEVISDDCDGDLIPDVYEIALDPSLDCNGDGVLDSCSSANYCTATNNSTSVPAVIGVSGSPFIADNAFTLEAWDMPLNEFAYFLMSESTAFVPDFGGSSGNLCVGAPIVRFNNPSGGGQVLNSGTTGTVSFTLDLTFLPQGTVFLPGDTWYFQLWFRDFTTGPTSNTTDGIEVMFR
jgi:hypothetical protein